ncbi:MAG: ribonuclease E/G, partial [Cyanobacteria bacterium J06648_11]
QFLQHWNEGQIPQGVAIGVHREAKQILEYFRVNAAIKQALRPRVDLPSGGYIIIEPTEALTVVDVNSGSFTRSATSRETVLWTNCEAATEIARQLRLRNIAGVIVVDFIDMDSRRDQLQVLEHFQKALRSDKARPQIAQLSELGLVELTRKRQGQSIYEVFGRPCPTCEGLGLLAHLPGAHLEEGESVAATVAARNGGSQTSESTSSRSSDRPSSRRKRNYGSSRRFSGTGGSDSRTAAAPPIPKEVERTKPVPVPTEQPEAIALDTDIPDQPPPADAPASSVIVEMTPLQQRVYSEMGLSPQLLVDKSVKVGRNTSINVISPGEQPPQVEPSQPAAKMSAADRRAMRRMNSPARRRTQPGVIDLSQTEVKSGDREERSDDVAPASQAPPVTDEGAVVGTPDQTTPPPAEAKTASETPAIATESEAAPDAESITETQKSPAASRRRRSRSS